MEIPGRAACGSRGTGAAVIEQPNRLHMNFLQTGARSVRKA
jgi:hypothetical protein